MSINRSNVGLGSTNIPETDLVRPLTAKGLGRYDGRLLRSVSRTTHPSGLVADRALAQEIELVANFLSARSSSSRISAYSSTQSRRCIRRKTHYWGRYFLGYYAKLGGWASTVSTKIAAPWLSIHVLFASIILDVVPGARSNRGGQPRA